MLFYILTDYPQFLDSHTCISFSDFGFIEGIFVV